MTDLSRLPRLGVAGRDRLEAASRREGSAFLIEGRKAVADVIASGRVPLRELVVSDDVDVAAIETLLVAASSRRIPIHVGSAKDVDRAADAVTPQGVLAVADDPSFGLPHLVQGARGPLLLLDGVQDPGNVGAILRVAAAFGAAGVLVSEGTADPLGAKALRASAGTALTIPFARGSAAACRDALEARGFAIWLLEGAAPGTKGVVDLFETSPPVGPFALAVGSEGRGASAPIAAAARVRVSIPIAPGVESLNAAVAVGIAAARLLRPRPASSAPADRGPARRFGGGAPVRGRRSDPASGGPGAARERRPFPRSARSDDRREPRRTVAPSPIRPRPDAPRPDRPDASRPEPR